MISPFVLMIEYLSRRRLLDVLPQPRVFPGSLHRFEVSGSDCGLHLPGSQRHL